MARKKPLQYIPREERPEFLALVAELANVLPEQFPDIARQCAEKYHDAVLAGHVEVLDQMEMAYTALVYQLNGETLQGCAADDSRAAKVLARAVSAKPGQVPCWGQDGEFLLEVDGLRLRVVLSSDMLGNHHACALHAVDLDKPFINTEGFRAAILTVTACLGETVDQAARRLVLELLQAEGGAKPIAADAWARTHPQKVPGWLADALAGVRPNGQLAMFGDVPEDPDAKKPMSNRERQKLFRQRQREKRAALKSEGLHTLELSGVDLARLFVALDTHMSFDTLLDWDLQAYRELAARLFKGENNAAAKVQQLGTSEGVINRQKQLDKDAKRGWDAYHAERKQNTSIGQKLSEARAEVQRLQSALQEIAAEVGGAVPVSSKVGEVTELRRTIAGLENKNAAEIADRAKAFDAVAVLTARLKAAGLSTDYRKQPGE